MQNALGEDTSSAAVTRYSLNSFKSTTIVKIQVPDKAFAKAADTTEGREGAAGGQDPRLGAGANSLLISKC